MDEAESAVSLDLSGRSFLVFEGEFPRERVGELPTELVSHFFRSFSDALGATLHISVKGNNAHHMVESTFKGVGRALRTAIQKTGENGVPSTKGVLGGSLA
jgi:imidazoleglycerol-phosphate dehydratase/histidinol-phosphatase